MAHMEKRASPMREFQLGIIGGAIYGSTHTLAGHSLDNLKVLDSLMSPTHNLKIPHRLKRSCALFHTLNAFLLFIGSASA